MTIGIYKLEFHSTDKVYIGQSIHIEVRYKEHLNSIKYYLSPTKLSKAIQEYGISRYVVLEECKSNRLNDLEIFYIDKFNSFNNGFNSTNGGDMGFSYGEGHPASSLTNADYFCILWYLSQIPTYTLKDISNILEVSESIVENISSGTQHNWLMDIYPELYTKVADIQGKRRHYNTEGTLSPIQLVSPSGVIYTIGKISEFCLEHGLHRSHIREVLKGRVKSHNGWHLLGTQPREYPLVQAPDGTVYSIPFGSMKGFAIEHDLSETLFRHLLQKKAKSHKGWRLAEPNFHSSGIKNLNL